jgi:hypothetical protein
MSALALGQTADQASVAVFTASIGAPVNMVATLAAPVAGLRPPRNETKTLMAL